ncbi:hypothetical protein C2S52_017009 [Perilla frutescens var. hirtella]|nr:hypothetical protein C2S52_017009 [Perilla frutescens var. hirtella]KAH6810823.1 hypothetical protein C2S51_024585 [Perilla frutescens var. frutescens]
MSSDLMIKQRTCFPNGLNTNICKFVVICTILVYAVYIFLPSHESQKKWSSKANLNGVSSATNISHLVFGIAASSNTWRNKRLYVQAWWRPNVTRGYVFMDRTPTEHLPWPSTYPPFRVSEDNSRYREYNKHRMPFAIRMVRVIEETFKVAEEEGDGRVRWYVMADDDTVMLVDNLVGILSKYDHNKYYYVGMNSESIISNVYHSFGMAFGGGGYALSYPLAKAVAQNMDICIKRYPTLYGSDHILQSCIADLGVALTQEKGFHQIDLRGDISGFLSAHPQCPLISLHHLDAVDPIFPSKNRTESVELLMKAASVDESRLLQQSVCYLKKYNWTISAAWGYSIQIYDTILPPSHLHRPLQTFSQWLKGASPPFMFNVRPLSDHPCHAPHLFFFNGLVQDRLTTYTRTSPPPACASHSPPNNVTTLRIHVLPSKNLNWLKGGGGRRECCDVVEPPGMDPLVVNLRSCAADEIVA